MATTSMKLRPLLFAGYLLAATITGISLASAQAGGGASGGSAGDTSGSTTGPGIGSGTGAGTATGDAGSSSGGSSITGGGSGSTGPTNPAPPQQRMDNTDMCPPGAAATDPRCRPGGGAAPRR